ncbi:MAG: TonB-dependent receptor [Ramlibacter sp.]|jgi:iron complex outermembrane receptor protein|nr:TonB-dependent receptor [Ramlibacter sp.]
MTLPPLRARLPVAVALAWACHGAHAQTLATSLVDLSLEQLSNIQVTSVAKREQRLADVAGAVYVISQDDIRRAGATSLPEALRLAPNLHVARADANQYAISSRGQNSVLANKMLVLIDGRTVYSPLFSGVFWEAQDVMLEDVERIEVLSGSGGTLHGSNAVNGVINIITRAAGDTQGALVSAGTGNRDSAVAARWGASTAAGTAYRLYARHTRREASQLASGAPLRDAARMAQAGFRADRTDGASRLTLQGDLHESQIDEAVSARRVSGVNLLGRWRGNVAGGQGQLQAYFDRAIRDAPSSVRDVLDTFDIEYQHALAPRGAHNILLGGGWRTQHDDVTNYVPAVLALLPAKRRLNLANVFAQDEIALGSRVKLTLGLKLEHNDYTGLEHLPSARLAWDVAPNHLLWAAVSRNVRAPARVDRDYVIPLLPQGSPNFQSEIARVYEVGWRAQPSPVLSYALTLYHHDFSRLRSVDLSPAGGSLNNNVEGRLNGLSSWAAWRVTDRWRMTAAYVHTDQQFRARPGVPPPILINSLGNDPRYRVSLGSSFDIGRTVELDLQVRRVGALPDPAVPAYTALDARLGWRVNPALEVSVTGRNLNHARHVEWGNGVSTPRSVFVQAVWRH